MLELTLASESNHAIVPPGRKKAKVRCPKPFSGIMSSRSAAALKILPPTRAALTMCPTARLPGRFHTHRSG